MFYFCPLEGSKGIFLFLSWTAGVVFPLKWPTSPVDMHPVLTVASAGTLIWDVTGPFIFTGVAYTVFMGSHTHTHTHWSRLILKRDQIKGASDISPPNDGWHSLIVTAKFHFHFHFPFGRWRWRWKPIMQMSTTFLYLPAKQSKVLVLQHIYTCRGFERSSSRKRLESFNFLLFSFGGFFPPSLSYFCSLIADHHVSWSQVGQRLDWSSSGKPLRPI